MSPPKHLKKGETRWTTSIDGLWDTSSDASVSVSPQTVVKTEETRELGELKQCEDQNMKNLGSDWKNCLTNS